MYEHPNQGGKPLVLVYLALIAVVTILLAGVIEIGWQPVGDHRPPWSRELTYQVTLEAASGTNFTVLLPILEAPDGSTAPLLQSAETVNSPDRSASLLDSDHGTALAITGRGRAEFRARVAAAPGTIEPLRYSVRHPGGNYDFNMWNTNLPNNTSGAAFVWTYVNSSNSMEPLRVHLVLAYPAMCASHSIAFEGSANGEWVAVPVDPVGPCSVA